MKEEKLPRGIKHCKDREKSPYRWRFMYDGVNYSGYEKTARKAEKAMNAKRYEVEHGLSVKEKSIMVDAWFEQWIGTYKTDCKPNTIMVYQQAYKLYIKPQIGAKLIKDVKPATLQRILNNAALNYSRSTLTLVKIILSGMFRQAERTEIISNDPMRRTTPPKGKKSEKKGAVSDEIVKLFLAEAKKGRFYRIYRLASLTGMRVGEILALQPEDVGFDKKTGSDYIIVRHTLAHTKDRGHYLGTPKSRAGCRTIPITKEARQLIREQLTQNKINQLKAGPYWKTREGLENLIFLTSTGGPVTRCKVDLETEKIRDRMQTNGIDIPENFTVHSLRHCFATKCIASGMNFKTLETILGHSSIQMTLDKYADALPDTITAEMQRVAVNL